VQKTYIFPAWIRRKNPGFAGKVESGRVVVAPSGCDFLLQWRSGIMTKNPPVNPPFGLRLRPLNKRSKKEVQKFCNYQWVDNPPQHFSEERIRILLRKKEVNGFVLEDSMGGFISYCLFAENDQTVILMTLWVDPFCRRKGIGTWLLKHFLDHFSKVYEELDVIFRCYVRGDMEAVAGPWLKKNDWVSVSIIKDQDTPFVEYICGPTDV
jgi:ribosomal protein S18 acetylase RimI-like enzyme